MSVEVGSAVGYLDLDIRGFLDGLKSAQEAAAESVEKVSQTWTQSLESTSKAFKDIGGEISKYISLPIAGAGAALLKFGADFEKEMKNLSAIAGFSAEELAEVEKGIRGIAFESGMSQTTLARSARMVAEAGGSIDLMMSQLKHGANLANATGEELDRTLDMVGSTMKVFGLETEQTQEVVDSLAQVTRLANTTLSDVAGALQNAGGSASLAGLSIHEVNAMLVEFANQGLKGGAAGTALNRMLSELANPSKQAKNALMLLGVELDAFGSPVKSGIELLKQIEKGFSTLDDEQTKFIRGMLFNSVSLQAWDRIAKVGVDTISDLAGELGNLSGEFDELGVAAGMAAIQQEGLWAQIASILPRLQALGNVVLNNLKPSIEWAINAIKEWLEWLEQLSAPIQTTIIAVAAFAAAIGPLILGFGILLTSFLTITAALPAFIAGLGTVVAPLGLIVAGLTAFGVAIYKLWTDNEEFRNKVSEIWGEIAETFSSFIEFTAITLEKLGITYEGTTSFISELWKGFVDFLGKVIVKGMEIISTVFYEGLLAIRVFLNSFSDEFNGDWTDIWDVAGAAWKAFLATLQYAWYFFSEWFNEEMSGFGELLREKWDGIFTPLLEKIQEIYETAPMIFQSIALAIIGWLLGISAPVAVAVSALVLLGRALYTIWETNEEFRDKITEIWHSIVDTFWNAVETVTEKLGNLDDIWQSFCNMLGAVIIPVLEFIKLAFEKCVDVVVAFGIAIHELWEENEYFRNSMMEIWNTISSAFWDAYVRISDVLRNLGYETGITTDSITNAFKSLVNLVLPYIEWAFKFISDLIVSALDFIATYFEKFSDRFEGDWSNMWNVVESIMLAFFDTVESESGDFFYMLSDNLYKFLDLAVSTLIEWMPTILATIGKILLAIISAVLKGIWNLTKSVSAELWQFGKDLVYICTEIGKQMLEGIWKGIQSAGSWFRNQREVVS